VDRKKAIFVVILLLLLAAAVAAFKFSPKKYTVGTNMPQALVFWDGQDAFVFLTLNTTGRARNIVQEKAADTKYGLYLAVLSGGYVDFAKQDVVAYHLTANGKLDRYLLPDHTTATGSWSLVDGRLQLTPPIGSMEGTLGFRWDGANFIPLPATAQAQPQSTTGSTLAADDDDDGRDFLFSNQATRQQFKDAGWHYKVLSGFIPGGATEATLPIDLSGGSFNLTIETLSRKQSGFTGFDPISFGAKSLRLFGGGLSSVPQVLWQQTGWQSISQSNFARLKQQDHRHQYPSSMLWFWLGMAGLLFLLRVSGWLRLIFTFATMKRRVLKTMATSFSFPPATPAQFPILKVEDLDRYTRELEGLGFTRLLDFSLVSDSRTSTPNFCRLFTHTRHHCFATVNQFFPKGKAPLTLSSSIEGCLQNGWTVAFANRKPQAASSLLKRRKALGVAMPEATISELLQAFLKMRDQVCLDLGISPVNDDTLEAYVQKMQRSATEMRDAVQSKNFAKGLPEVYLRKLSLLKAKPEYVWLGDYPKEAEQRKQGMSTFAAGTS